MAESEHLPQNTPEHQPAAGLRLSLKQLFYGTAMMGAGVALFGLGGVVASGYVSLAWMYIFTHRSRWVAVLQTFTATLVGSCLILPVVVPFQEGRSVGRWIQCKNNLKMLSLAIHGYHANRQSLPPLYTTDESGNRLHSWRTLILPYLEHGHTHGNLNLTEPWNSPQNTAVHGTYVEPFLCPEDPGAWALPNASSYYAVTGPGTMWPDSRDAIPLVSIPHRDLTIMLIEDHTEQALWCEPRDPTLRQALARICSEKNNGPHLHRHQSGSPLGRLNVAMADGQVRSLRQGVDRESLRILFDPHASLSAKQRAIARADPQRRVATPIELRLVVFLLMALLPAAWLRAKPKFAQTPANR